MSHTDKTSQLLSRLVTNQFHQAPKNNPAQKMQENSFHQSNNVDSVFEIESIPVDGPVFLLDDAVDSGWTMTMIASLLLNAGSGQVYPIALTSTNIGA